MSEPTPEATAYHEAGHAVVGAGARTAGATAFSILADRERLGHVARSARAVFPAVGGLAGA